MTNESKEDHIETEAQQLVDEIPEFGDFIKELSSHLSEWDKALERNREYYRRNPNAPPITEDTPPLDSDE